MKNTILLILSIASLGIAQAQPAKESFKVLVNKGQNQIKDSKTDQLSPIAVGVRLYENQVVIVSTGSYLSLIHFTGRTLELKEPGTFNVSELNKKMNSTQASIASKYASYVAGELTKAETDINKDHRKYMAVTGSVERSTDDNAIHIDMPRVVNVAGDELNISWFQNTDASDYTIKIMNLYEEPILSKDVKGSSFKISASELKLEPGTSVIIVVENKNDPAQKSGTHSLKRIDKISEEQIKNEHNSLKLELAGESATNCLIFANFYEQKGLYLDADYQYKSAIQKEPDVEAFSEAYVSFRRRNGLE